MSLWFRNGGKSVLSELGLSPAEFRAADLEPALCAALGTPVVAEIKASGSHRETGSLLLVHAGVDPLQRLDLWFSKRRVWLSDENHYAWIRFPFLGHHGRFEGGRIVVHGHTPEAMVMRWKGLDRPPGTHELDGWRLGLDGGSYQSGIVAGAEFRDGAYRIWLAVARG
jgi:serine/threonine protein phosphatase 1